MVYYLFMQVSLVKNLQAHFRSNETLSTTILLTAKNLQ